MPMVRMQNYLENYQQKAPCQSKGTCVPGVCSALRCLVGARVVLSGGSGHEGGGTETPRRVSRCSEQQRSCHTEDAGHALSLPWVSRADSPAFVLGLLDVLPWDSAGLSLHSCPVLRYFACFVPTVLSLENYQLALIHFFLSLTAKIST